MNTTPSVENTTLIKTIIDEYNNFLTTAYPADATFSENDTKMWLRDIYIEVTDVSDEEYNNDEVMSLCEYIYTLL